MTNATVDAPTCRLIELTPAFAEELLSRNTRNRSLRRIYVRKLADAMTRGEWIVNGEPIQVAQDGTLLNGQHRLHAVVESGVTVPTLLVTGLPPSTQHTMDIGARRNLSDVLALRHETDTNNLAAMLGLLYRYRHGHRMDGSGRTAPTTQEALELLERESGIKDYLPLARRVHRETKMRVSMVALLAYLFDEVDAGRGEAFFEALVHPDEAPRRSPVRALRSILERSRQDRKYAPSTYALCAMTVKAFNAWQARKDLAVLAFRPGTEPFPKILPRPG